MTSRRCQSISGTTNRNCLEDVETGTQLVYGRHRHHNRHLRLRLPQPVGRDRCRYRPGHRRQRDVRIRRNGDAASLWRRHHLHLRRLHRHARNRLGLRRPRTRRREPGRRHHHRPRRRRLPPLGTSQARLGRRELPPRLPQRLLVRRLRPSGRGYAGAGRKRERRREEAGGVLLHFRFASRGD